MALTERPGRAFQLSKRARAKRPMRALNKKGEEFLAQQGYNYPDEQEHLDSQRRMEKDNKER